MNGAECGVGDGAFRDLSDGLVHVKAGGCRRMFRERNMRCGKSLRRDWTEDCDDGRRGQGGPGLAEAKFVRQIILSYGERVKKIDCLCSDNGI